MIECAGLFSICVSFDSEPIPTARYCSFNMARHMGRVHRRPATSQSASPDRRCPSCADPSLSGPALDGDHSPARRLPRPCDGVIRIKRVRVKEGFEDLRGRLRNSYTEPTMPPMMATSISFPFLGLLWRRYNARGRWLVRRMSTSL